MKQLPLLLLALLVSSCASGPKPGEPAIPTTATGTVTVSSISTSTATATSEASAALSTVTSTATSVGTGEPIAAPVSRDVISGQVVGEEPMMEVSKHANVRLLQGSKELANITAEPDGSFRFEGTFEKGRYEISVRDGKLHGAREISFTGGKMTELSVVVTDGKGDKHHRRRRKRH
jgi:hypothetical protein